MKRSNQRFPASWFRKDQGVAYLRGKAGIFILREVVTMKKGNALLLKGLLLLGLTVGLYGVADAGQQYNPFTGSWETAPDSYVIRHNSMDGSWSYQSPDATIVSNPFQNTWDWQNPDCKKPSQDQTRKGKGKDARLSTNP